jgi:glycosyltransferase involved in cell wall biosynthesis
MKFVQVAESLAYGDAIANDVVAIDGLLREMGSCGGIFATNSENIDKRYLHKIAEPLRALPVLDKDDVLLLHHAISNDFCYKVPSLKCKKILIYHNITPPDFFDGLDEGLKNATAKGLVQTRYLHDKVDGCIADSEFNKKNLENMGYKCPIYVCPILVNFEDYAKEPDQKIIEKFDDEYVNIIFVGRISPNKKQEDIIRTFALYKKYYNAKSRLFLVGSTGLARYAGQLRDYAEVLGLDDVYITGSVTFADVLAYYRIADVFLCMSEHEGFCVPLLEAMYFDVPIIAYSSSAIPWTLGGCGILLPDKNFLVAAGLINELVTDDDLRKKIVEGQKKRCLEFSYQNTSAQIRHVLENIDEFDSSSKKYVIESKSDDNNFDVLVVIKASDWPIAKKAIPYIRENLRPRHIIFVSSQELQDQLPNDDFYRYIDENKVCEGMSLASVRQLLKEKGGDPRWAGWFLQQFIKLYYAFITEDRYYLGWDADTLPLTKIDFFDHDTQKPYFTLKREYVDAYFATIKNLFGYSKSRYESFIAEHMLFDAKICREMIMEIESLPHIQGNTFYEKCIAASEFRLWNQTFSEYETFGTYIFHNHPEAYKIRRLRTLRPGREFLGDNPDKGLLEWASKNFDTISFEQWSTPIRESVSLCNQKGIRQVFPFSFIIKAICRWIKIKSYICVSKKKEYRDMYNSLKKKMGFDYFFGEDSAYTGEIDTSFSDRPC